MKFLEAINASDTRSAETSTPQGVYIRVQAHTNSLTQEPFYVLRFLSPYNRQIGQAHVCETAEEIEAIGGVDPWFPR